MFCYVCSVGDYMPHKQALHLPSMLTAKAIYERMQLDLVQTVSQAQFYKLWNQHFPNVTIPAVSIATPESLCSNYTILYISA